MIIQSVTPPEDGPDGPTHAASERIRVVIADDHPIYRDGLAFIINADARMAVVGEADNGRQLLQLVKQYQPDVVLSDIKMPDIDGIRAVREITGMSLNTRCILISQYDNDRFIMDAIEAGAIGYLIKKASKDEIIEAIQTVFAFRQYFCRFASAKLAKLISRSIYHLVPYPSTPTFSEKEKEIISLLCEEKSSEEIGKIVFMSARTVEGHKTKIMKKTGAKTTVGIVVYAIRHGLFNVEELK